VVVVGKRMRAMHGQQLSFMLCLRLVLMALSLLSVLLLVLLVGALLVLMWRGWDVAAATRGRRRS
jgi:hypothetical protein